MGRQSHMQTVSLKNTVSYMCIIYALRV
uniref:Uncharacterized protein n=1 Tax=Anguilla anguilla TaxID=7936 RepID=A0A0E9S0G4_ANGAN